MFCSDGLNMNPDSIINFFRPGFEVAKNFPQIYLPIVAISYLGVLHIRNRICEHIHSNYPYKLGKYGIPFSQIVPNRFDTGIKKGEIKGGSGRNLTYELSRNYLSVYGSDNANYSLYASVDEHGSLLFSIATRLQGGPPHPDMFAAKFIDYSILYLKKNGVKIKNCKARWYPGTTNYSQFQEALKTGKSKDAAARQTWEGKQLRKHGFKKVKSYSIDEGKDAITYYFYK